MNLFIKWGCVFLFLKPWLLPIPSTQDMLAFTIFFLHFFVSHAKTSTGNNARFRQERTMGRASQWFVFPSARWGEGGGGGGLFSCCDVKRSLLFFCPLPQRWVCHSDLYHHSCPPPHNCVNLQHTQYISMYSLVFVCIYGSHPVTFLECFK